MTTCTCGGGHQTYGACLRAKNLRIGWCRSGVGLDATVERAKASELDLYKAARAQGIQPPGTSRAAVEGALELSDAIGRPWDAANPPMLVQT